MDRIVRLVRNTAGSKTRLSAVAMALLPALVQAHVLKLTPEQVQYGVTLCGALGLFGLRDAVQKAAEK